MDFFKRRYIFEEGEEENNGGSNNVSSGDTSSDAEGGNEDYSIDTSSEEDTGGEEESAENNTEETDTNQEDTGEENTDEDYSVDASSEEDAEGEETGTDNDTEGEESTEDTSSEDENGPGNNELDKDLFDNLTEDEQNRKVAELKKLYSELYDKCNTLIEKFNHLSEGEQELQGVSKRILKIVYDLREYISYYVLNIFDKKSYLENDINFNRYLLILNGIKDAVGDISKAKEKEND